jgi:predicted AlkP superfamily pyrophosphatase or phosphodiesterase
MESAGLQDSEMNADQRRCKQGKGPNLRRGLWATVWLGLLAALWTAGAGAQGHGAKDIRHVIVISVDGLMPVSYLNPDQHGLKVPTLRALANKGAASDGATSVFPTLTYPAHASIATGAHPGTHGIVANETFDPLDQNLSGWRWYAEDIRVPTLWDAARAHGLRTALVGWPVTVGAQATALLPEYWRAGNQEDIKLNRALSTPGLLDAVARRWPDFWERYNPPRVRDSALTDIAVHLIETQKPHLLLLHIFDVDHEQHHNGPWSEPAKQAIEDADAQIARVIAAAKKAGIWKRTALVVVSDHGFVPFAQRFRPGVYLAQRGLVSLDTRGRVTDWKAAILPMHGLAYLYVKDAQDERTQRELTDLFDVMKGKLGSGIRHVYRQEEIRALGGDPQAFLALAAQDGYDIVDGYSGDVFFPVGRSVAGHGPDPRLPGMAASLLVYGPAVRPGKIEQARLIDVAPTVAKWLGFKMEKAEGRPLDVRIGKGGE